MESAEIAIIGGTASIDPALLRNSRKIEVSTPYGRPSDKITVGELEGFRIAILPRHGKKHTIAPHQINFRANIHALKSLGVRRILATATAGSLKDDYEAGDIVIPDQFIDWGKQTHSFVEVGKVYHVSMADPFCPVLRKSLVDTTKKLGFRFHEKGTYLRIEGPQFSTRAASRMYRQFGDIIGMTCIPEAILAREMEMCFAVMATVTDYDVWKEHHVTFEEIRRTVSGNIEKTRKVLREAIKSLPKENGCRLCPEALKGAEA